MLLAVLTEVKVKGCCLAAESIHEVAPYDWLFTLWSVNEGNSVCFSKALGQKIAKSFNRMSLEVPADMSTSLQPGRP